jgi:hypothetical protein
MFLWFVCHRFAPTQLTRCFKNLGCDGEHMQLQRGEPQ